MRTLACGVVAALLTFFQSAPQGPPPGGVSFTGQVTTGSGPDARPVRRAKVVLAGRGLLASRVTDTDTKGGYRFDRLPAGDYKVSVQKAGFVKLGADAPADATLTMVRGGAIEGVVTDAAGDPLWNVVVTAGRFDVRGLPPEDYLAVALPSVIGTEFMDPEFLQQLRPYATAFVLTEGETKTLELKVKKRP